MEQVNDSDFYVSEIFQSIQGEGNYSGVNALFVRFQLCNLRCTWCDTKYTWTANSGEFRQYAKQELIEKIESYNVNHVIFTGGEPSFYRLDQLASNTNIKYHVETNGSIIPTFPINKRLNDGTVVNRDAMDINIIKHFNWVVSPKLKHSKQNIDIESLKYWNDKPFAIFKFVIKESADIDELEFICVQARIAKKNVYLGLEGNTPDSQLRPQLVEEIIARGFHFSPRLHVLLWGNERLR